MSLIVVLSPVLGPRLTRWLAYDRPFASMAITARTDAAQCPGSDRPILVEVKNGSSKGVAELSFYLNAHRPGHSLDVSNGGEWVGDTVAPGSVLRICAPAVLIEDATGGDPRHFLWSARLSWVRFAD